MEASILIPNFFNPEWYGESELTTEDLGWSDMIKRMLNQIIQKQSSDTL